MNTKSSFRRARSRLPISAPWIWLLAVAAWLMPAAHAAPPPNLILVMTDDQGYGDLGCHGNIMIRTPNLDRLHGESVRLTNFHVDPTCSPTRGALLTGRYSTRTGIWHTIAGRSLLHHDEVTLADILARAGFSNGMFGKWHLGDNYPMRPQDKGFQVVVAHGGGGITQTPDHWGNTYFNDSYFHNGKPIKHSGYCTDVFFQEALSFIETHRGKPFFVYLPTNVPHGPFNVEERYRTYYLERGVPPAMASFYGMIENFDENMGRLLARLKEWDLERNTILVYMTDNGTAAGIGPNRAKESPSDPAWNGFNAGLRGQKGSEYDGGHRVPCFIRWPDGNLATGSDINALTAHIDLLPTLLDLCGVKTPVNRPLDGTSLAPLLRDPQANWPARTLFVHSQRIEHPEKWRKSSVMTDRWRLVNGRELYDMSTDPGQQRDVSPENNKVVEALRANYDSWWESLTPRFDQHARIVIGAREDNPAAITCHDWHSNRVPWNQPAIQKMPVANGYWMIDVERAGTYAFTLRHQPEAAQFPLQATRARVKVDGVETSREVPEGATSVTIQLKLKAGPARLQTWLETETTSRGAFFVDAQFLQ